MANTWRVPYVNFPAQWAEEGELVRECIETVFSRGDFVGGGAVATFEAEAAAYCGVEHAVALNSGTDALIMSMRALGIGPGDEVITPPNSFVASAAAIAHLGATPVFADVLPDQNMDPEAVANEITQNTRAIMPVHLTGRVADMAPIMDLAKQHGLLVIEDAAQAIGSMYDGKKSGTFGDAGCFSAHPLKNLNAGGDAGYVTTNNGDLAENLRRMRNHGLEGRDTVLEWGWVSRMDTLQAALLSMRLARLDNVNARRRHNAALYHELLDPLHVFMPPERKIEHNTWHTFVIQVERRDALKAWLTEKGIETAIHYPVPLHLQPAAIELGYREGDMPETERQAARILTLPVNQFLKDEDIEFVANAVNRFFAA
jgi:dTDP-4-amino-4,6-dideoxygalactose transaminase